MENERRLIEKVLLSEPGAQSWTMPQFTAMLDDAIKGVPGQELDDVEVSIKRDWDDDEDVNFSIIWVRRESDEEYANRIARKKTARELVDEHRASVLEAKKMLEEKLATPEASAAIQVLLDAGYLILDPNHVLAFSGSLKNDPTPNR